MRDHAGAARAAALMVTVLLMTTACTSTGRELPAPKTTRAPTSSALTSATALQSGTMTLASPLVAVGGVIPAAYLQANAAGPPPLQWSAPPATAVELAVTIEDDAAGTVYWIVTGLGRTINSLDATGKWPEGAIVRPNSGGRAAWSPPPLSGSVVRLRFTVWAMSTPLVVNPAATAPDIVSAIASATAAKGVFKAVTAASSSSMLTPN
jgi:phosphatidylethanolamine-binding protein (PEBP) family uncharacterized protein